MRSEVVELAVGLALFWCALSLKNWSGSKKKYGSSRRESGRWSSPMVAVGGELDERCTRHSRIEGRILRHHLPES